MRITWVTRSFLDYRIPVYEHINHLCGNNLTVVYYKDVVPVRCQKSLEAILGDRAIGLSGEFRLGGKKEENQVFANTGGIRIPLRPGLVKKVKETKPDIMLSDGFFQWTYAALVNRAIRGIPHIMCYERTKHTERNVTKTRIAARKLASRYIDAVCCNGIQTKEYLLDFGFHEDRLFIGNMAADTAGLAKSVTEQTEYDTNQLKNKYGLTGKVFLYVGQLIPRKGIFELLNAWKRFESKVPGQSLVLLGKGEQFEAVQNFIAENDLKNIYLPGQVDYSEVVRFYAVADIFVMPTLEDNWSLVVPEAMSCSLPVICSKYNGCWPEMIKPENGWVFDPHNNSDFDNVLLTAWDNREHWEKMGTESFQIVEKYSPEKIAEKIFQACKITLAKLS